ncbi:MAG: hypothetical protein SVV80_06295 [Planctomycetota bacterium]|nr:hypothetical protein [Planctomycetota bacterium]
MKMKIRTTAVVFASVLAVSACAPAAPVIKDYSSTGGNPVNKTGPQDSMYLVKGGDKITFTVKADGAEKYVWQVNKQADKGATGETLTWTVPDTKGIWEIHVTAGGEDGSAHTEWVVSTLDEKEAPDIFEYFTDGRFADRSETDPWGRAPPDWYSVADQSRPDPSRCFLQTASTGAIDDEGNINSTLYLPSDITYGTWKFRFLLPASHYDTMGGWTHLRFCFIDAEDGYISPFWYTRSQDSHNYTGVGHENRIDHDIGWAPVRKLWQEVKIIRTPDGGLFTWADGVFQFRGRELRGTECASMNIKLAHYRPDRDPTGVICLDTVEVYRDKYLFPPKSVRFGQYIHDWEWRRMGPVEAERWFDLDNTPVFFRVPPKPVEINFSRYSLNRYPKYVTYLPVLKEGIVIDGRDVRLQDIAARVRNKSLFSYDRKTKTAVCGTNLVISEGAELVLDDETLKFDCSFDGQHEFVVMFGSTLNVKNSMITTTDDHYFNWRLDSMTHFGFRCGPIHSPRYTGPSYISNLWYHGMCTLFLHGSTIDNFAYMFISSPMQVDITDTKFTNIHEIDTAEYNRLFGRKDYAGGAARGIRNRFKGEKGFWMGLFGDKTNGFNVRGVTFGGKKSPLGLTFFANDEDYESFNVYDIKAPEENIVVGKGYRIRGYRRPEECESTVGLVNAKFANIVVPTDKAGAVVKYYLHVKAVGSDGKAIPDAKVKVTNEVDNDTYPAETADGSIIVADYVQDRAGKKEFTYTVEVSTTDGRRKSIKGVDPNLKWYREEPNKPTHTITVVLDGK